MDVKQLIDLALESKHQRQHELAEHFFKLAKHKECAKSQFSTHLQEREDEGLFSDLLFSFFNDQRLISEHNVLESICVSDESNRGSNGVYLHALIPERQLALGAIYIMEKISISPREVNFYQEMYPRLKNSDANITPELFFLDKLDKSRARIFTQFLLDFESFRNPKPSSFSSEFCKAVGTKVATLSNLFFRAERSTDRGHLRNEKVCELAKRIDRSLDKNLKEYARSMMSRLEVRMDSLNSRLSRLPVCASHNDLSGGNIMVPVDSSNSTQLMFIDWGSFGENRVGSDLRVFLFGGKGSVSIVGCEEEIESIISSFKSALSMPHPAPSKEEIFFGALMAETNAMINHYIITGNEAKAKRAADCVVLLEQTA